MGTTFRPHTLALGTVFATTSIAAIFGACTDSYRLSSAAGTGGGASTMHSASSAGGGGGLGFDSSQCQDTCSNDLKSVVDCKGVVKRDSSYCRSDDCKAWAKGDASYCHTDDCKGIVKKDASYCRTDNCKAMGAQGCTISMSAACTAALESSRASPERTSGKFFMVIKYDVGAT